MNMKLAIVTGITGQAGFYLTKLLLEKQYIVVGLQRRTSTSTGWRLQELPEFKEALESRNLIIEYGDITDFSSITRIVDEYQPNEFYSLAAQSHVWHSFKSPLATLEITGIGAANCLEAVRQFAPQCKFYQASSSEMFGNVAYDVSLLNESSHMLPRSPYGAAKLMAHALVKNYREAYNMFAVGGILFNYESPYRGLEFVTRKITHGVASLMANEIEYIELGNLEAKRDWGHCADYMNAAWLMLQQPTADDYVIATGETHSIKEFLDKAFACVGIIDWTPYVKINDSLKRPSEIDVLIGDASKARRVLGWSPSYSFDQLVNEMVLVDCIRKDVADKVQVLTHNIEGC